jgi:ABC-2 type transport system permease protein
VVEVRSLDTVDPSGLRPPVGSGRRPTRDEVGAHWRLYRRLVGAQIRSEWQYRTSFVFFVTAQAMITALELAAIVIILDVVPDLGGWSPAQVALLYGLATVPFALTDVIISPIEELSTYVRMGTFDRLLLRPMSALVQLCATEFELRRAGKLIPNLAALVVGLVANDLAWTIGTVMRIALALTVGSLIYAALWITAAAVSFWLVSAKEATNALTYGGNFSNQYPLHLYPRWIRAVLGWAVPLAFVAYVPAIEILDAPNPLSVPGWFVAASPVVALASLVAAGMAWSAGIRHYQGTGS